MNKQSRKELKRLAGAATQDEWFSGADPCAGKEQAIDICKENIMPTENEIPWFYVVYLDNGKRVALIGNGPSSAQNSDYIAAANPAAIQSLLAEFDRLEAQRDRLLSTLREIADDGFENSRDRRTMLARAAITEAESQS